MFEKNKIFDEVSGKSFENIFSQITDLFDQLPAYVYFKDRNSRYRWCNQSLAKLIGLKNHTEIVGKTDKELPWGAWRHLNFAKIDQEIINKKITKVSTNKLPIKRKDGNYIYVKLEKIPVKGKDREVYGILGIATDITQEKLVEEKLKDDKKLLEDIFNHLPSLIYWKNQKSEYIGFNENVVTLSGLTRKELFGKTDEEVNWGKKDGKSFRRDDQYIIETGKPCITEYEIPIRRPDGHYLILRTEKSRLFDREGNVIGVLGVGMDVTDQKILEKKIAKQRDKAQKEKEDAFHNLEYIISNMPGYIYWKNKNSQYMGCNNNLAKFSHLNKPSDIVGKTDYDFDWGKNQAEQFIKDDKEIMATGKISTTEYELPEKREDGHCLYVRTDKMPFYDKKGKVIGILAVAVDVTNQKVLEKSIIEEKERAEAANKIKTEFIRNIEHDIRTPFSGIWGMANFLWERETDDTKKEWLGDISHCAKELLDYCNDVLDFSKIESNERLFVEKKFNLRDVLSEVVKVETPPAKIRNLSLKVLYDEKLPPGVLGDRYRLYRILINLIGNAIKFTHEGEVSVEFKMAKKDSRQVVVQFIVTDTGIGIPEEKQLYIYEKFSKLSPSNKGIYKGVGIGLTIAKQFITEMEGEIELESKVGVGSKFTCTIPFKLPLVP